MANRPIRASQVISPFGVGAMMDFPGPESLIQAGLDTWPEEVVGNPELQVTNEPALARSLGVDFFVTPPPHDRNRSGSPTIAWLRFPRWHACTNCGLMKQANLHDNVPPRCDDPACGRRSMQQVRFVAACRNGHLRDFPWLEWLALREGGLALDGIRNAMDNGARLRLWSTGESGAGGLQVQLVGRDRKVLATRSLAGAFGGDPDGKERPPPLTDIVRCGSENPALGISPDDAACQHCDAPLIVVLRGAGNVYFTDVDSAIHIPAEAPGELPEAYRELLGDDALVDKLLYVASECDAGRLTVAKARQVLRDERQWLQPVDDDLTRFVAVFNEVEPIGRFDRDRAWLETYNMLLDLGDPPEQALKQTLDRYLKKRRGYEDGWRNVPVGLAEKLDTLIAGWRDPGSRSDEPARSREYRVFSQAEEEVRGLPKSILKLRSRPIAEYGQIISHHFDHIGLLDTLRETRVLKGFSRLYARKYDSVHYRRLMWRTAPTAEGTRWLPATKVFGEGIFLKFSNACLGRWEQDFGALHQQRLSAMQANLRGMAERRGVEAETVDPRRVLIHTFAHLLINQLVFDSGYGSSSLRERIYVSAPSGNDPGMAGLLIYTASGDSEGSMGGLVRMGEPGRLEGAVRRALENALWCSSDPVCIESQGQGPDNCNLAACHSCALLPETSCELQNRVLDRGVVIGTLKHTNIGYFSGISRTHV